MKILLIAKPWRGGLGLYYYHALNDMFPGAVEWLPTRPDTLLGWCSYRANPKAWWAAIHARIANGTHDVALFVGYHPELKKLAFDARNILYLIDAVDMHPGDLDALGRVFISDPGYRKELAALVRPEQNAGPLPFACYPPMHRPHAFTGQKRDVVFIGTRGKKRDVFLRPLLHSGYTVSIIGNYFLRRGLFWQRPSAFQPSVSHEGMGAAYARHNISINIHSEVVRGGTNMRSFECAGYGIPQVIEWREGIEDYFVANEEIVLFRTAEEMLQAINMLRMDAEYRSALALRARARVLREHSYYHRIVTLLQQHIPTNVLEQAFEKVKARYAIE